MTSLTVSLEARNVGQIHAAKLPPGPAEHVRLAELPAGAEAVFEAARIPAPERALLAALGLRPGAILRVRCGGGPCIVQVDSTRLAIAGPLARRILVRRLPIPLAPDARLGAG